MYMKKAQWQKGKLDKYLLNQQSSMRTEQRIWCSLDTIPAIFMTRKRFKFMVTGLED